jgi:hypothetical protein
MDPIIPAAALYLAAHFVSDRMVVSVFYELSPEEKARLVDTGAGRQAAAYIPSAAAVVTLGCAVAVWPEDTVRIVVTVLVVFIAATVVVALYSWGQMRALGIRESYLRRWALSRVLRIAAVAGLCAFLAWYSVNVPV